MCSQSIASSSQATHASLDDDRSISEVESSSQTLSASDESIELPGLLSVAFSALNKVVTQGGVLLGEQTTRFRSLRDHAVFQVDSTGYNRSNTAPHPGLSAGVGRSVEEHTLASELCSSGWLREKRTEGAVPDKPTELKESTVLRQSAPAEKALSESVRGVSLSSSSLCTASLLQALSHGDPSLSTHWTLLSDAQKKSVLHQLMIRFESPMDESLKDSIGLFLAAQVDTALLQRPAIDELVEVGKIEAMVSCYRTALLAEYEQALAVIERRVISALMECKEDAQPQDVKGQLDRPLFEYLTLRLSVPRMHLCQTLIGAFERCNTKFKAVLVSHVDAAAKTDEQWELIPAFEMCRLDDDQASDSSESGVMIQRSHQVTLGLKEMISDYRQRILELNTEVGLMPFNDEELSLLSFSDNSQHE